MSRADKLKGSPVKSPRGPVLRPGGFSESFGPYDHVEMFSSTCAHCQHITDFPSKREMYKFVDVCRGCMKLICLGCSGKPCRPWEQECERIEAEERLRARLERDRWGCY